MTTDGDDERFLAAEGFDEGLRFVVVNLLRHDAVWQLALAVRPCNSCNNVLACLEQGFCDKTANVAAGLYAFISSKSTVRTVLRTPTTATLLM